MTTKMALMGALMLAIGIGVGGAIEREKQVTWQMAGNCLLKLPSGVSPEDVAAELEIERIKERGRMMSLSGEGVSK